MHKFEEFIKKHKETLASIQKSLEVSLRIAKYELEWYKAHSSSISRWLRGYDNARYRLPRNIKPEEYVIFIKPDFENGGSVVEGSVTIEAKVVYPTHQIILHSSNIIHKTTVMVTEEIVNIISEGPLERYDQYVIYLDRELPIDTKLTIKIEYKSNLDTAELRGIYKSSYVNEKGVPR